VQYKEKLYQIPANPVVKLLRDTMTGIQRGKIERGEWSYVVPQWDGAEREHDVDGQKVNAA
jgi:branched-chain amino acid aminotransferase